MTLFNVYAFCTSRYLAMNVIYFWMGWTKTFLVPSLVISAIATTIYWIVLHVVVTLMIASCETLGTHTWAAALHALEAPKRSRSFFTSHYSRAHRTFGGVRNGVVPIELHVSDILWLVEFLNKGDCSFRDLLGKRSDNIFEFF